MNTIEQREIKFRVWDTVNERMVYEPWLFEPSQDYDKLDGDQRYNTPFAYYETWQDCDDGVRRPCYVMQHTGLKDKNGVEIYHGDILRIKGRMGNDEEYGYDALYKVILSTYEGLSIRFLKLTNQEPDSRENSYPIRMSMGFSDKRLSTDYRNNQYNRLVVADGFYDDSRGNRHQDHHYTNDIEVVGNIFTHPHLLQS